MKTLQDSLKIYSPVLMLSTIISRRLMTILRTSFFIGMILSAGAAFATIYVSLPGREVYIGLSLIFAAFWLEQLMIYSYHNSFYFKGLHSVLGLEDTVVSGATYDVAAAVRKNETDVTAAFLTSPLGKNAILRAGISAEALASFLHGQRPKLAATMVHLPEKEIFSLIGLGKYLLAHDPAFKTFVKETGTAESTVLGSLRWVVGTYHQQKQRQRWWSKDNLSTTTGIGSDWSYGTPYTLERFSRSITTSAVFSTLTANRPYAVEKITDIETSLARSKAANVLIIGESGVGKMDLVMSVQERMQNGEALNAISNQHIVVLDTQRLFSVCGDKQSLEQSLEQIFLETERAGNTIIVIEHIDVFIEEAQSYGVYIPELLDAYLASPHLHFIFTTTPGAYHTYLEPIGSFTRRCAEIFIDTPNHSATTRILEEVALSQERTHQLLFTYPALAAMTSCADRYIVDGVMPDKAVELLMEVTTRAAQQQQTIITDDFVYQVVSDKINVPAGPIQDEERDKLLHLEDTLHQKVIGQDRALTAIARTMRRARAGIQAADKPVGSFLFLGPTGVGKTETAKALATIFFGGEHNLQRLDMSEFSSTESLERLLGTADNSSLLADLLREHPYCVLLLDEFEKANQAIHDLFLQVLDEGVFTDGRGTKVNARNCIIIATSNAGSQLIVNTVEQRKTLAHLNQDIIKKIIDDNIFRPELINRFDDTIIFEPLSLTEQSQVASLMLGELYERIRERGYELVVGKDLLEVLVEKGYHPEFGARPMRRVLQDVIEEKVAQKIIAGKVHKGDTIRLSKDDFTTEELAV